MSLKDRINEDLKTAMKAKDQAALRTLRAIKSAILLAETAEGRTHGTPLTEAEEMDLLTKQVKQRRDSIEQYTANNRADLAKGEEEEVAVLQQYLPSQLEGAELEAAIQAIIAEVGAASAADFGKVMKVASTALKGRADGKLVAEVTKKLLA